MSNRAKIRQAGRFHFAAAVRTSWNQPSAGRGESGRIEQCEQASVQRILPPKAAGRAGKPNALVEALKEAQR